MRKRGLSVAFALATVSFVAIASSSSCGGETSMPVDDAMTMPVGDSSMPQMCPSGYQLCGNTCTPTKRDPENCGACGKPCKSGEVCVQGSCALQCGGGATKCNNLCVNTKADPNNCGQCGTKCTTGEVC